MGKVAGFPTAPIALAIPERVSGQANSDCGTRAGLIFRKSIGTEPLIVKDPVVEGVNWKASELAVLSMGVLPLIWGPVGEKSLFIRIELASISLSWVPCVKPVAPLESVKLMGAVEKIKTCWAL